MPLLFQRSTVDGGKLAVWRITEAIEFFAERINWTYYDRSIYDSISNDARRLEWLGSRWLIRYLLPSDQAIELEPDEFGQPVLHNQPFYIGLSHSRGIAGAYIHPKHPVALDVEHIDKKIDRIGYKFTSDEEKTRFSADDHIRREYLTLLWSAKETMYKFYGKRGLAFSKQLLTESFERSSEGIVPGNLIVPEYHKKMELEYRIFGDIVLVYNVDVGENIRDQRSDIIDQI